MSDEPAVNERDEAVAQVFGPDPWMRFDIWSTRAWEASQAALAAAAANGTPANSNDDLDPRIITAFHAAAVAKDFASMVNPIPVVSSGKTHGGLGGGSAEAMTLAMLLDGDD